MRVPSRLRSRHLAAIAGLVFALSGALVAQLVSTAAAAPTELFLSEYVEGSSNNKALEVYNGTGSAVTLTGHYDVQVFANGSPTATATIPLTGTVAGGDVFVLARSTAVAAILAVADQTTTNFLYNGDDAVVLRRDGTAVDVIGQLGLDPGTEWGSGATTTLDHTLRRKASVQTGDPNGADPFDPSTQWDGLPLDTFAGLGAHSISAGPGGGGSNRAPDAVDDTVNADEDGGPIPVPVLGNDVDPDGDPLVVASATDAAHGTVVVASGGSGVSYAPEVDFSGTDSFTYTVSDGRGGTDTATVTVVVEPSNDDPEPADDEVGVTEDVATIVDVLANDVDPDGGELTVTAVEEPDHGTATIRPGEGVRYEPDPDFNGTDGFEYTVSDGQGGTELGEVTVVVAPVNDPPRAASDVVTVSQGSNVTADVLANDVAGPADEAAQTLAVTAVGPAAHGSAEIVSSGPGAGSVRYTPGPAYVGSDSFSYTISDGSATATGTVNVVVRPVSMRSLCGLTPTIVGTRNADVIAGTPGDDVILARRGNDTIGGNGGNDIVCGGPGADRITTLDGTDRIAGGSGADSIAAGGGSDRIRGGVGADDVASGTGDDSVAAGAGDDVVDAGEGTNVLAGGPGDDSLTAGTGDDRLDGGPGNDDCDAGAGRNTILQCE